MDFCKAANDGKAYNLVHCWIVLKDYDKLKQTYASSKKSLNNGNAPVTVDLKIKMETMAPSSVGQGATRPPRAI
jgi:hypothetical protein